MSIKVTVGNDTFFRPGKGFGRISTRKSGLILHSVKNGEVLTPYTDCFYLILIKFHKYK